MTGSSAVDSLLLFLMAIVAIVFLGKLVLRRAGRSVVKFYPTAGPIVLMPPLYPPGVFHGQPYPGIGHPPATHPPAYPAPAHPPAYPAPAHPPTYSYPAEQQPRGIAGSPAGEGDQFDEIVRDFYGQR